MSRFSQAMGVSRGVMNGPECACVIRDGRKGPWQLRTTIALDIEVIAEQLEVESEAELDLAARGWW